MHPDFPKYDPLRAPKWRCTRATSILDGDGGPFHPSRGDDTYVRTFLIFLRKIRSVDPTELAQLQGQLPGRRSNSTDLEKYFVKRAGLWYAFRLHFFDSEARTFAQACILAREDDHQIAARWGTLPDTFKWYEKIFFDVRDRLDNAAWIRQAVLSPRPSRPAGAGGAPAESPQDLMLKTGAYYGGRGVLDDMLAGVSSTPAAAGARGVEAWMSKSLKSVVKAKALTALAAQEPSRSNVGQLLTFASKSAATDVGDDDDGGYKAGLKAIFTEGRIPWHIKLRRESTEWEKQFEGAAEPRSHERLMIAEGRVPPDLVEYYKAHPEKRKYPELPLGDTSVWRPDEFQLPEMYRR